jgi:hypothetical protein
MDDDGKQPLSYLAPENDVEEVDRRREGRTFLVVMAVGTAMFLGVWAVPELVSMFPNRAFTPGGPNPQNPVTSVVPVDTGSAPILAALEEHRHVRGRYPASLDQLSPLFNSVRPDRARWRYVASPDGREYQLHHLPEPQKAAAAVNP